jgi:F0F1-type ATP synthase assembly protein I
MADERTDGGLRGRDLVGLGGMLIAGVVGGTLVGILIDRATHSTPTATLIGLGVGTIGSIVACVVRVRSALGR